jgi:carbon storage regulator
MLVLSRKVGEQVIINSNIIVTVLAVCGNQVRLGIKAPNHVRVLRGELTNWSPAARQDVAAECPLPVSAER